VSRGKKDTSTLVIGGEPRIDLLPPEYKAQKENRRKIRSLILLAALVAVVCVAGYAYATGLALQSQVALAEEQAKTPALIREQGEYIEAQVAADQLADANNAKLVASSTEILWKPYVDLVYTKLPAGTSMQTYTVSSQSSVEAAAIPELAFESANVGTMIFAVTMSGVAQADELAVNLRTLPGLVDASVLSVIFDDTTLTYTATVSMTFSDELFERRFFPDYVAGAALLPAVEPTEGEG